MLVFCFFLKPKRIDKIIVAENVACMRFKGSENENSFLWEKNQVNLWFDSQDHKTRKVRYFPIVLSVSTNYCKIPKALLFFFWTFRNHVKIFLSRDIMHIF